MPVLVLCRLLAMTCPFCGRQVRPRWEEVSTFAIKDMTRSCVLLQQLLFAHHDRASVNEILDESSMAHVAPRRPTAARREKTAKLSSRGVIRNSTPVIFSKLGPWIVSKLYVKCRFR